MQVADCNKASTPANWVPGQPIIKPSPTTFKELQERSKEIEKNRATHEWLSELKKKIEGE